MPKPTTQKEMLTALYTEVLGINGKGGMRKAIEDNRTAGVNGRAKLHDKMDAHNKKLEQVEDKVDHIEATSVTKDDCLAIRSGARKEGKKLRDRSFMWIKDLILLLIAVYAFLKGFGVF